MNAITGVDVERIRLPMGEMLFSGPVGWEWGQARGLGSQPALSD